MGLTHFESDGTHHESPGSYRWEMAASYRLNMKRTEKTVNATRCPILPKPDSHQDEKHFPSGRWKSYMKHRMWLRTWTIVQNTWIWKRAINQVFELGGRFLYVLNFSHLKSRLIIAAFHRAAERIKINLWSTKKKKKGPTNVHYYCCCYFNSTTFRDNYHYLYFVGIINEY